MRVCLAHEVFVVKQTVGAVNMLNGALGLQVFNTTRAPHLDYGIGMAKQIWRCVGVALVVFYLPRPTNAREGLLAQT